MPIPAIPLIWFGGGAAIGYIIGKLFGESKAAVRIRELQNAILELEKINRLREQEIAELRAEIERQKAARTFIEKFIRFITGEAPELIEKFKRIQKAEEEMVNDNNRVVKLYNDIKSEFPEEVKEYEIKKCK
ncbi:MAG: hypothetical protein QMC67_13125 [Candidatus Wallbacteria bacterium]